MDTNKHARTSTHVIHVYYIYITYLHKRASAYLHIHVGELCAAVKQRGEVRFGRRAVQAEENLQHHRLQKIIFVYAQSHMSKSYTFCAHV